MQRTLLCYVITALAFIPPKCFLPGGPKKGQLNLMFSAWGLARLMAIKTKFSHRLMAWLVSHRHSQDAEVSLHGCLTAAYCTRAIHQSTPAGHVEVTA